MDGESSSSTNHLRANWTPSLDHYFIDLLLDQVHKGNKSVHAFGKQAWGEMILQFNTKFGFKYDTDVLKNRYKRLRKQFGEVKTLLDKDGFSWDETLQMVTADNSTWDEYIKAHPDMQSYRMRVLLSYTKLCIICGYAVADGRYSLSCFDVDFDNEGTDDQIRISDDRSKVEWSPTMDQFFLKLMLDEVHKKNKIGRSFKKKAWAQMIRLFNDEFGFHHGKVILKNRYNILRKQYACIKYLLDQNGFSWDEKQQMVVADDHTWNKHIKALPNYRRYKDKTVPSYTYMSIICRNETTSVKNDSPQCQEHETLGKNISKVVQNTACEEALEAAIYPQKRGQSQKRENFHESKKVRGMDGSMRDVLREMTVAVTSLPKEKVIDGSISTKKVIDELQALPDIDDDLLLDACDLLEDEKKARMFLALDATLRKRWLLRKLRPQETASSCALPYLYLHSWKA